MMTPESLMMGEGASIAPASSAGPAMSDGGTSSVTANMGAFYFKGGQSASLIERALPVAILGGVIWLLMRRR